MVDVDEDIKPSLGCATASYTITKGPKDNAIQDIRMYVPGERFPVCTYNQATFPEQRTFPLGTKIEMVKDTIIYAALEPYE